MVREDLELTALNGRTLGSKTFKFCKSRCLKKNIFPHPFPPSVSSHPMSVAGDYPRKSNS